MAGVGAAARGELRAVAVQEHTGAHCHLGLITRLLLDLYPLIDTLGVLGLQCQVESIPRCLSGRSGKYSIPSEPGLMKIGL